MHVNKTESKRNYSLEYYVSHELLTSSFTFVYFSKSVSTFVSFWTEPSSLCLLFPKTLSPLSYYNVSFCFARLAQLDKRRSAEWEAAGSSPGRTNTQGL